MLPDQTWSLIDRDGEEAFIGSVLCNPVQLGHTINLVVRYLTASFMLKAGNLLEPDCARILKLWQLVCDRSCTAEEINSLRIQVNWLYYLGSTALSFSDNAAIEIYSEPRIFIDLSRIRCITNSDGHLYIWFI